MNVMDVINVVTYVTYVTVKLIPDYSLSLEFVWLTDGQYAVQTSKRKFTQIQIDCSRRKKILDPIATNLITTKQNVPYSLRSICHGASFPTARKARGNVC